MAVEWWANKVVPGNTRVNARANTKNRSFIFSSLQEYRVLKKLYLDGMSMSKVL
jgi:hypothetical protein